MVGINHFMSIKLYFKNFKSCNMILVVYVVNKLLLF